MYILAGDVGKIPAPAHEGQNITIFSALLHSDLQEFLYPRKATFELVHECKSFGFFNTKMFSQSTGSHPINHAITYLAKLEHIYKSDQYQRLRYRGGE